MNDSSPSSPSAPPSVVADAIVEEGNVRPLDGLGRPKVRVGVDDEDNEDV